MKAESTEKEREKDKEKKRRIAAGAVAVVTSASMVAGGLFSQPAALVDDDPMKAVVAYADDDGDDDGDEAEEELEEAGAEEEARPGLRARLRQKVLELPLALRLLVILPLWALGWGLRAGLAGLWGLVLSPVAARALAWLLVLAALVLGLVLAGKAIFPDLPVKKILNRRSLLWLLLTAGLLGVLDCTLPFVWADYTKIEAAVRGIGLLLSFGGVTTAFALREHKRRKALPPVELPPEPEEPAAPAIPTREEILAMADSVSRR